MIKRHVPNAQLIAVLRHPSDRAYSDHLMHIRDNVGTRQRSLSEQIKTRANKSFVIRKGFYHEPLKYFYDEFGSEKIKVFLYDDLCRNPIELMQNIYEFIGVDKTFSPNVAQKAQVAQVPKSQAVNSLLRSQNPVRTTIASTLKLVFPLETRQKIRNHLLQLNYQDKSKAPFSPQDRQALTELYREDILKLQELLQRDLSGWLKK